MAAHPAILAISALPTYAIDVRSQLHGCIKHNMATEPSTSMQSMDVQSLESVCNRLLHRAKVFAYGRSSMGRLSFIGSSLVLILLSLAVADSPNEKSTSIPLDQIWAYKMPGTRDIADLEPKRDVKNLSKKELLLGSPVNHIIVLLGKTPKEPTPGFAVVGRDKEALQNSLKTFEKKDRKPLPKDTDLSLVFFSYTCGSHVKINSVDQTDNNITIKYQFVVPAPGDFAATRFALIPIGKLPKGKVQVKCEQVPPVDYTGKRARAIKDSDRYVSGSFSFEVQ